MKKFCNTSCKTFFREPLSKRSYLKHIGIRSTVAFIMAQAADINVSKPVILETSVLQPTRPA